MDCGRPLDNLTTHCNDCRNRISINDKLRKGSMIDFEKEAKEIRDYLSKNGGNK